MPELRIIRGLPGSGKSTLAASMEGFLHFEANMYFSRRGEYKFDHEKLSQAHNWCLQETKKALLAGRNVVVANTFVKVCEMMPYRLLAIETMAFFTVYHATGEFKNTHEVPGSTIARMKHNWQKTPMHWRQA